MNQSTFDANVQAHADKMTKWQADEDRQQALASKGGWVVSKKSARYYTPGSSDYQKYKIYMPFDGRDMFLTWESGVSLEKSIKYFSDYFTDRLNPIPEECILFEIELGYPYLSTEDLEAIKSYLEK